MPKKINKKILFFLSINPIDRNPLMLDRQGVECGHDLSECLVEIFVDDDHVDVLFVGSLQGGRLF